MKIRPSSQQSASLTPVTMKAAITRAYMAIADCTPVRLVFRPTPYRRDRYVHAYGVVSHDELLGAQHLEGPG